MHRQRLWTMRADGSRQRAVPGVGGKVEGVSWSPTGDRILYSRREKGEDLWTIAPDGTHRTRITRTPKAAESQGAWAPDGRQIAYTSNVGKGWRVYVADPDGSGERLLTPKQRYGGYNPAYSPDGTRVAFHNGDDFLYTVNANGSDLKKVGYGASPAWSPDSQSIVLSDQDDYGTWGKLELLTMDTGDLENLTPWGKTRVADHPDWLAR